ncbi:YaaA family protein [Hoylesella oralis]|uniref:YaaA family protein n=1 Tax=Hoylesella oralis TaxID=28134 RepID=UPI003618BF9F
MQILLACAKDMKPVSHATPTVKTVPLFQQEAEANALEMMKYSAEELAEMMKTNRQIGALNKMRYTTFLEPEPKLAAVLSYTGIAYKHLRAEDFSADDFAFAQKHLWITSFLYGLLRPLDRIKNYRLEGYIRLPKHQDQRMFDYWKPLLTDVLIESAKQDDGILLNLASEEMKGLFDWHRIKCEIKVIEVDFMVLKGDTLKTVVVYAKMCRGAMARYVIKNKLQDIESIKTFEYEGFCYNPVESTVNNLVFSAG